jgi:hypothetical protein
MMIQIATMVFHPLFLLAFGVTIWALWGFSKWLVTPSLLNIIPGPPSKSWLLGGYRSWLWFFYGFSLSQSILNLTL